MSKDLSIVVNNLKFENPFLIASGPPSSHKATIMKAFEAGWGGVVAKTISLDASKVHNVAPRYGKLYSREKKEVVGLQHIELIGDRPIEECLRDFREVKDAHPKGILIASLVEEFDRESWQKLARMTEDSGVDALELHLNENSEMINEITEWVTSVVRIPVWAKVSPNVADMNVAAFKAIRSGAQGISLINSIASVIGVDLDTLRPLLNVKGFTVPGGYSGQAVRPIALKHTMKLAKAIRAMGLQEQVGLSGMGGVERASDAVEFMLLGASTIQSCTGPMLHGYQMINELKAGLEKFMIQHNFDRVQDFVGLSLDFFTTHAHLNDLKQGRFEAYEVARDSQWNADHLEKQTHSMAVN